MQGTIGPRLKRIHDLLYGHFGPQGWWPGDSPTEIVIGAILTQSVSWRNVEKAIDNLKKAGLLDFSAIHRADPETLARLIVPTRYYRQKARRLKTFAAYLLERHGGSLERMFERGTGSGSNREGIQHLREELLALPGIGPETADSILLYGGDLPVFVVDAYTRRIFARLGLVPGDISYSGMQYLFMVHLPADAPLFNEYHALIVALGHNLCLNRKPRCEECPLRNLCDFGRAL